MDYLDLYKFSCRPLLLSFLQGLEDQESLELAALCAGLAAAEVWGHDVLPGRGYVCL